MRTIAVTGVSGYLGQRLLARLDADARVDRVVGVDVSHPPPSSTKLEFHECDIRDPRLASIIAGCDVLVYLAFVVDPIKDVERMRAVNVDGTAAVLDAVAANGVGAFVYASSASVYGACSKMG